MLVHSSDWYVAVLLVTVLLLSSKRSLVALGEPAYLVLPSAETITTQTCGRSSTIAKAILCFLYLKTLQ